MWPDLSKKLEAIPAPREPSKPTRSQHQILEELVASVRSLEGKLREVAEVAANPRSMRSHRSRMHPMMLNEMAHLTGKGPGDPLLLLMLTSLVREEIPWLYELAVQTDRAARSGNKTEAREAMERLRRASHILMEGPFLEEFGVDPRMLHFTLRKLDQATRADEPELALEPDAPRREGERKKK